MNLSLEHSAMQKSQHTAMECTVFSPLCIALSTQHLPMPHTPLFEDVFVAVSKVGLCVQQWISFWPDALSAIIK